MNREQYLFVVSGPSGAGKDTVVGAMRKAHPEIEKTVSVTTRPVSINKETGLPEQDGVEYHFRTAEQFAALQQQGQILESNCYCGNYYGTLRSEVEKRLAAGKVVVLVIDVHGAANLKRLYPGCTTVFLNPPSEAELERRLRSRGRDTEEQILQRLATAREEMKVAPSYDRQLVNDQAEDCARQLYALICARTGQQ